MSKLSRNWIEGGLRAARVAAVLGAAAWFSGCAPLLVGGAAVGGAMVFSDRRTSGTQIEDQSIEVKAANRAREVLGDRGHLNFTSYNRTLLITGEVPSEADRTNVERAVAGIENLRAVVNELGVLGNSALASRSSDAIITSKVKATFVDAKDLHSTAFKVVTERGTVYLLGRVTEREATRATELARGVGGVEKVVRVFEILTESELSNLQTAK